MSEKFGLDWKKYDVQRMTYFNEIMNSEMKRAKIENDKAKLKNQSKPHGKPRG